MKYPLNTVSQPVVGKEAEKLAKAIESGGHVASKEAIETMNRIIEKRNKEFGTNISLIQFSEKP